MIFFKYNHFESQFTLDKQQQLTRINQTGHVFTMLLYVLCNVLIY